MKGTLMLVLIRLKTDCGRTMLCAMRCAQCKLQAKQLTYVPNTALPVKLMLLYLLRLSFHFKELRTTHSYNKHIYVYLIFNVNSFKSKLLNCLSYSHY